jgi:hypothetical protein
LGASTTSAAKAEGTFRGRMMLKTIKKKAELIFFIGAIPPYGLVS